MGTQHGRYSDNIYLTSDIAFASYLLLKEFTLLGAIDNESPRKEFGLLQPEGTVNLEELVTSLTMEYEVRNYREFFLNLKTLRQSLDSPVRREL